MNNSFNFVLLEVKPYTKNDKEFARIVLYCSFGYLVNIFTTKENAQKLIAKSKEDNFNVTKYINVYYDNSRNNFSYSLKFND